VSVEIRHFSELGKVSSSFRQPKSPRELTAQRPTLIDRKVLSSQMVPLRVEAEYKGRYKSYASSPPRVTVRSASIKKISENKIVYTAQEVVIRRTEGSSLTRTIGDDIVLTF